MLTTKQYIDTAQEFAEQYSPALRLKVGAVVVRPSNGSMVGIGANFNPTRKTCEYGLMWGRKKHFNSVEELSEWYNSVDPTQAELRTYPQTLHAEPCAMADAIMRKGSIRGFYIYVTHEPCLDCAKQIYLHGIRKVYYRHPYRLHEGIEFLKANNIEVIQE